MTSLMHASTGLGIGVALTISPLASCGFARHANIARVCGAPRCGPARHEHPMQHFAMTRYRKHRLGVMPSLAGFTGARKLLTSGFPDGKNRRGSMPESSLTEDAEITPDGNVSAASAPAAIGVDVTGIPSRTAERGMIIDTHMRADDDPMLSRRPDVHSPTELLVNRNTPVPVNRDRSISAPPQNIAGSHAGVYFGKRYLRPRQQAPLPGRLTRQ